VNRRVCLLLTGFAILAAAANLVSISSSDGASTACGDDSDNFVRKTEEAFEFTGRVTAEGRALAGAEVRCAFAGYRSSTKFGPPAITDRNGNYRIQGKAKRFKLIATHPDYRREVSDWLGQEELTDDPVELDLKRGVRLHGLVLDARSEPVANARLRLRDPDLDDLRFHTWQENDVAMPEGITSNVTGAFEFEPALGKLTLTVAAPDGARSEQVLDLAVGHGTDSEGRRQLVVRLEDGSTVSGRVELDGEPIEKVHISWSCSDRRYPEGNKLSDPLGEFTLKQLSGIEDCAVVATPRDQIRRSFKNARSDFLATQVPTVVGDRNVLLSIRSETPGSLTIRFDGSSKNYHGKFELTPIGAIRTTTPTRRENEYSREGSITFTGIRPGDYILQADLQNGMDPGPVEINIVSGDKNIVALEVPDGMARGTATGRAVDAETGRPLSDVFLTQSQRNVTTVDKRLDTDGRFEFNYVAETLELWLKRDGYRKVKLEVDVGSGESAELGDIPMDRL
jgi:hypothetical protein